MRLILPLLLATVAALAGCATVSTPPETVDGIRSMPPLNPAAERGHDFAVRRCAGCHTVGPDDGGAREGPAFRTLAMRYNPIALERRFAEVAEHGIDRMPPVSFTRSEAEDLMAYLYTLESN